MFPVFSDCIIRDFAEVMSEVPSQNFRRHQEMLTSF